MGESYWSGEYIELYDGRQVVPDYERLPSPKSNPIWVQFFQNHSESIVIVSMIAIVLTAAQWGIKTKSIDEQ